MSLLLALRSKLIDTAMTVFCSLQVSARKKLRGV